MECPPLRMGLPGPNPSKHWSTTRQDSQVHAHRDNWHGAARMAHAHTVCSRTTAACAMDSHTTCLDRYRPNLYGIVQAASVSRLLRAHADLKSTRLNSSHQLISYA